MDYNIFDKGGSTKYIPNISAEKITETSSKSFMDLCRTEEGRIVADRIISNYLNNGTKIDRKSVPRRNSQPKAESGKELPSTWSKTSEDQE